MVDTQDEFNQQLFDSDYYRNYADRTEIQSVLLDAADKYRVNQKRADAQAAATGATNDQISDARDANNKMYSDMIAGVAKHASTHRDAVKNNFQNYHNEYFRQKLGISDKLARVYNNEAAQMSQAGSNFFSTAANAASGIESDGTGSGTPSSQETNQSSTPSSIIDPSKHETKHPKQ